MSPDPHEILARHEAKKREARRLAAAARRAPEPQTEAENEAFWDRVERWRGEGRS